MENKTIKPTAVFTPFSHRVEIKMYGAQTGDWSLKCIDSGTHAKVCQNIAQVSHDSDVRTILGPRPKEFNARIIPQTFLATRFELRANYSVPDERTIGYLYTSDEAAEGVEIPEPREQKGPHAGFFYTADCAVVVLYDPVTGKTVACHAGRDSLIERELILTGRSNRPYASVIDAAMAEFERINTTKIHAFISGATSWHEQSFDDPTHAEYNLCLTRYLLQACPTAIRTTGRRMWVSITELIENQLIGRGITPSYIGCDCIDVTTDQDAKGNHLWWSHQRWFQSGQRGPDGRNGIFVIRRW